MFPYEGGCNAVDKYPFHPSSCPTWKSKGYCTHKTYKAWMQINCKKTCTCGENYFLLPYLNIAIKYSSAIFIGQKLENPKKFQRTAIIFMRFGMVSNTWVG